MKMGYLRIHLQDTVDDIEQCMSSLKVVDCEVIHQDQVSKSNSPKLIEQQPILQRMIEQLQAGDIVVVTKLSRLTYHSKHLIKVMNIFIERQIEFYSLHLLFFET